MTVSETAKLLEELKAVAARIHDRAANLEKETVQKRGVISRQSEAELERVRKEQVALREQIASTFSERAARLEQRTASRKTRITKAHAISRRKTIDRIDETEGRRKFAVQKGILDTERSRDLRLDELEKQRTERQDEAARERFNLGVLREQARRSFRGYGSFRRLLKQESAAVGAGDPEHLIDNARRSAGDVASGLSQFRARVLPELFRFLPIWLWWLAGIGLVAAGASRLGLSGISESAFRQIIIGIVAVITGLYFLGWWLGGSLAKSIARSLHSGENSVESALSAAEGRYLQEVGQTRADSLERTTAFQQEWELAVAEAAEARKSAERRMEDRLQQALRRNEQSYFSLRSKAEDEFKSAGAERDIADETTSGAMRGRWSGRAEELATGISNERRALETEWAEALARTQSKISEAQVFSDQHFRPWRSEPLYRVPEAALNAVRIGDVLAPIPSPITNGTTSAAVTLTAPLMLTLPAEASILIESDDAGRPAAINCLNNIVYRILQTIPPGKAAFTLIDPVRLGQSFSSIMHLADFEENIVNRRIWTEPAEIEERLLELNAHMEKVIQMYLRNEFRDIVEYNKEAGRIAEKYHFLVIADFPANFSEMAMRRLLKIAASGARCGVFTLIHWDKAHPFLPGFEAKELIENSVHLQTYRAGVTIPNIGMAGAKIHLDAPPEPELATRFLQTVGEASRGSHTVQVPFAQITPPAERRWSLETTEELRVPIGRSGATKLQYLALGKGTRQHVLIAGKTGSGKSTLLHVLVTNLALWSSPEQVEFYLVDFKKGVEFKDYAVAKLPHARVVAIESDREFGLSVLRRVDEELRVRGELFRAVGAQDLAGYKRASRNGRMPRVLLIIDEFQELFVEDDAISQNAALLLDRIVRQGRAFGIHVVLGTQTLGGAYSLARSTLGQMVVRIALQTNEADAYLIMDENNPAPRLLSRPGEGIYNDSGGMLEANSPFQVVWLPESERRDALRTVRELAEKKGERNEPIVFEGNTLADITANTELAAQLANGAGTAGESRGGAAIWLGLPNEIKGPTHIVLDDRTGRNLLIAGQHDDHARALLAASLLSLAAQNAPGSARFVLLESGSTGDQLSLAGVAARLPHRTQIVKGSDIGETFRGLVEEIDRRETNLSGSASPRIFVVIHNLSAFKALRPEDEFSLSIDADKPSAEADFQRVYTDGPVHGIHVVAHVDGFNNANRFLGRKGLKEFALRVLFQMSASDSASFSDDARAGNLGLSRALLYDEQEGTYETFRPYARPPSNWLAQMEEKLRTSPGSPDQPVSLHTVDRDIAQTRIKD